VATHDDGRSRLFLDGPRYEKRFLVPSTCRSCVNPECMMNCPVGSIHRGNRGQMVIEDWCIGCERCAQYCPFGAIQMHDIGLISETGGGWRYLPAGDVSEEQWQRPGFRDDRWLKGATPFRHDRDFRATLPRKLRPDEALCFRRAFHHAGAAPGTGLRLRLWRTAANQEPGVFLNGEKITCGEGKTLPREPGVVFVEVKPDASTLRRGENVVAVRLVPKAGGLLFRLGVYEVPPVPAPTANFEFEPHVADRVAVVCDLCSTSPAGPACVNACPHLAAMRFDARAGVPHC
jgi:Fe-S-cluster-containing hydrogenase component 2